MVKAGVAVELSAKEFHLLRYFLEHRGATISRDELLQEVWGYEHTPSTRTVDVHVAWLRQKLEANPKTAAAHPHRARPRLQVRRLRACLAPAPAHGQLLS